MSMTGVIANTLTVIIGSMIGLIFKKGIPEKVSSAVMTGLGLCMVYIGIDGALSGENVLITIASMVIGSIIGTLIDIDLAINRLGIWVEKKFSDGKKGQVSITITKIKIANYLPAIVAAPVICRLISLPVFRGIFPM